MKLLRQKLLITKHKNLKKIDFFVKKYFDLLKTLNVNVKNTKWKNLDELFVKNVELKSQDQK